MTTAIATPKTFTCCDCHTTHDVQTNGGTGYATYDGQTVCYACCGIRDRKAMATEDRTVLYFTKGIVSNWPGSLKVNPTSVRHGRHNIAGNRIDVHFTLDGNRWHGVNIGDNDVLRCRKLKAIVRS